MKRLAIMIGVGLLTIGSAALVSQSPTETPAVPVQAPGQPPSTSPPNVNPSNPTQGQNPNQEPQPNVGGSTTNNRNTLEVHSRPQSSPTYQPRNDNAPPQYNLNENKTYRTIWK